MNDGKPVDPALFRLRTFESDWSRLVKRPRRATRLAMQVRSVLHAEALRWLEMGQTIGYFAAQEHLELLESDASQHEGFFRHTEPPDPATFGEMLADAREDLSGPRIGFLELFVFAEPALWALSLRRLVDFASTLEGRGWLDVEPTEVQRIGWSLQGAEAGAAAIVTYPDPTDHRERECVSPAAWRIELPDTPLLGLVHSTRAAERRAELEEARGAIITAITSILMDERRGGTEQPGSASTAPTQGHMTAGRLGEVLSGFSYRGEPLRFEFEEEPAEEVLFEGLGGPASAEESAEEVLLEDAEPEQAEEF